MEEVKAIKPPNPLNIPEILERISQSCGFQELVAIRQVSTFWKESSRKAWVSKSKVMMDDKRKSSSLSEFFKFARFNDDIRRKPYENYSLTGHFFTSQQFWGLRTSFLKRLELIDCKFESVDVFRTVIFKSLPNIQHLELRNVTIRSRKDGKAVEPVQWEEPAFEVNRNLKSLKVSGALLISKDEFLSHFPSLEVLSLSVNALTDNSSWFESIEKIRQRHLSALKLKSIRLDRDYAVGSFDVVMRVLRDPELPLEELEIKVDSNAAEERLRDIIWSHTDTLRKLHLSRDREWVIVPYGHSGRCCPGSGLKNALNPAEIFRGPGGSELKIEELALDRPIFSSFEFLECMPTLKSISIRSLDYEEIDLSQMRDVNLPECTKVFFQSKKYCPYYPVQFKLLMHRFPNIKELTVDHEVDNQAFSWICENCPHLVKLSIRGSGVDECGLTGLHVQDASAINKKRGKWNPIEARRPNISSFQCLREISLFAEWDSSIRLGYSAMAFGFQQLPNLGKLCLRNYLVEPKVKEALCGSVPICKIEFGPLSEEESDDGGVFSLRVIREY